MRLPVGRSRGGNPRAVFAKRLVNQMVRPRIRCWWPRSTLPQRGSCCPGATRYFFASSPRLLCEHHFGQWAAVDKLNQREARLTGDQPG